MAAAALLLVAISSCDEDALNIGQSLTDESDKLEVGTASFQVTTRTIMADSVLSLASDCYFGRVRDPETNADVTSEFTTQFHLLETTNVWPEDKFLSHYDGKIAADSCDIVLYLGSPFRTADSLVAMKMRVSEMATPLEEGHRYYSNFNPSKAGMLRTGGISKSQMFSYLSLTGHEEVNSNDDKVEVIRITLNDPYTAVDGTTYKNYGTYLLRQYFDHPEYYRNSYVFTHNLCPGFLFQITDGLGFHAKVTNIGLRTYYTVQGDTSVVHTRMVLAGTSEVLQTTQVVNDTQALKQLVNETQHTYLKTPAGLFTEVTLPVKEVKQGHESDSLLAAKVSFQRLNNESTNERMLGIPQTLLMVQKDSLHNFFERGAIPDNITSYIAGYNNPTPTSTSTVVNNNAYTFNNLSSLITYLWKQRQQGVKSDPQWEANHPDWNKMVLVPISFTTSSSSTSVTSVRHDMSLTSTRLVGGANNPHDPIQLSVVYAKF